MVTNNKFEGEMVMETPSPQCVGREFVRQYYTLLHEAPMHLHRFYSHNSNFVHGGVEPPGQEAPPVKGQNEIHKKILSLGFKDCHAKIRQVDSQATIGSAVVVQVTGELSNNGEPMRRFMQTFILAPQSPKKYYVLNDIFRYQDEVFQDDSDTEVNEEILETDQEPPLENGQENEMQEPTSDYFDQAALSNGSSLNEPVEELSISKEDIKEEEAPQEEEPAEEEEEKHDSAPSEPLAEQEAHAEPKPFSWAALASKNTPSAPPVSPAQPAAKPPVTRIEPKQDARPITNQDPLPQRTTRNPRESRPIDRETRTSVSRGEGDGDTDSLSGRRPVTSRYPDSHQLFVGNLPHNISEKELKIFFEQYGPVVELRINTKSSGGKLPNFGFVVFDSPDPVQDILAIKEKQPIKYNGEHRLNVEEKKPRDGRLGNMRGGMGRSSLSGSSMGRSSTLGVTSRSGGRGYIRSEGRVGSIGGPSRGGVGSTLKR